MIKNQKQKGFTLIEMIVSVAVFAMVVTISLTAILTIIDSNRKAQTLSTVMSKISLTVEFLAREIRVGSCYSSSSGNKLFFKNEFGDTVSVIYDPSSGKLSYSTINIQDDLLKTENNFILEDVLFLVTNPASDTNSCSVPLGVQPRVVISIRGKSVIKNIDTTNFTIQTSVTQRTPNI